MAPSDSEPRYGETKDQWAIRNTNMGHFIAWCAIPIILIAIIVYFLVTHDLSLSPEPTREPTR